MLFRSWGDNKIVFWDEVYKVVSRSIDKNELRVAKEKKTPVNPDISRIGKKINGARKAKGWTQKELAQKAGLSQQTISFVESGYINISFLTLKKIIDALDLKIFIVEKEKSTYTIFTD